MKLNIRVPKVNAKALWRWGVEFWITFQTDPDASWERVGPFVSPYAVERAVIEVMQSPHVVLSSVSITEEPIVDLTRASGLARTYHRRSA